MPQRTGILGTTAWRQDAITTVHLVNLTNRMMMKGPVGEVFPVGRRRFALSVRLCVAGRAAPFRMDGNTLELEVPSIELHELVAVDL